MVEVTLAVRNQLGLHARAAARLVRTANRFHCDIFVEKDGERVNGKSIMGVMMLAAECGSSLSIKTDGVDAESAMEALLALVADGFHEMHLTQEVREAEMRDAEQQENEGLE